MSEAMGRRSSSFNLLCRDSSGDGEAILSPKADKTQAGNVHRKRRRHKNRKSNLSHSSMDSSLVNADLGSSLSLPCSPGSISGGVYQESDKVFGENAYQGDLKASVSCNGFMPSARKVTEDNGLVWPTPDTLCPSNGFLKVKVCQPNALGVSCASDPFLDNLSVISEGQSYGNGVLHDVNGHSSAGYDQVKEIAPTARNYGLSPYRSIEDPPASGSPGWKDGVSSSSSPSRSELRHRIVHASLDDFQSNQGSSEPGLKTAESHEALNVNDSGLQTPQQLASLSLHTKTPQLLDWEQLMTANTSCSLPVSLSPFKYFLAEVVQPRLLQDKQSPETDKKRQHVYNTMFHVPWRCELLIVVGFCVCLDSFLSLLTIVPLRLIVFLWRVFAHKRQFQRLQADELSDLGSLLVLVTGVTLLQQADISYFYHMIRSQSTIKLYVAYNVLEIFDKLCQSFGSDVLQVVLNSAENVATCTSDHLLFESLRFVLDQCIAVVSFIAHSFIILAQSITVSAAIRSHNNALLTLLISNNFAEIKSNVFKRLAKDNLHKLAYLDIVERFHIIAQLFFVFAQNILAANEPWLTAFACNAGMVLLCEILVDAIKHAFLAKFNEIKPAAYSDFLVALCKQTLTSLSHEVHNTMAFVPYASACVVIRVSVPCYAAFLPGAPWWRFFCAILYCIMTYIILIAFKILVGVGLLKHANWYIERYKRKEKYFHSD